MVGQKVSEPKIKIKKIKISISIKNLNVWLTIQGK